VSMVGRGAILRVPEQNQLQWSGIGRVTARVGRVNRAD